MTNKKISRLDLEDLINKVDPQGFRSMYRIMEHIVGAMEQEVINTDINNTQFAKLAICKAKAEGARLLFNRLKQDVDKAFKSTIAESD